MSKWIVDIHGDIEGDYEIIKEYEEPKTGHWIRITNGGAMKQIYLCSVCHRQIEDDGIEALITIKYPYCHCGAKMVEPRERSEE